jgi:hypothetical protein
MNKPITLALYIIAASIVSEAQNVEDAANVVSNLGGRDELRYQGTLYVVGSTGKFAPYMIGSWNGGKIVNGDNALADLMAVKPMDSSRRFSWGAGAEIVGGYSSAVSYDRYVENSGWTSHSMRPAAAWIQQLYGEAKYRGIYVMAGMKDHNSRLVNQRLSSGDLVWSNNARPFARIEGGFVDFQNIPFTNGWAQIQAGITYGKFTDDDWVEKQYNYFSSNICLGSYFTYKHVYFRSKPDERLSVMIGAQVFGQYGGTSYVYKRGSLYLKEEYSSGLKAMWNMFLPTEGSGNSYYEGDTFGSWDFRARYDIAAGHRLSAYFQWYWEDGSGMARRNGTDGLWGLEYSRDGKHALTGVVLEYFDFRDQSGTIHWAPRFFPGTTIPMEATGNDNYYCNFTWNANANYGMSYGSPFVLSPVYNLDGFPQFKWTRSNGFHLAAEGWVTPEIEWRAKVSYAQARGTTGPISYGSLKNTSASLEAYWDASRLVRGLSLGAHTAFDAGTLRGDNFGFMATVKYSGNLNF